MVISKNVHFNLQNIPPKCKGLVKKSRKLKKDGLIDLFERKDENGT